MKLRALIVDDEYPSREEIRYHLRKYDNIDIVGEAATIPEAQTLINALDYHMVFLDINFPNKNGIDLGYEIQKLKNSPYIIYVTAYEEYAVKAFDVNATDYILKPINEKKFERAINRVIDAYSLENTKVSINNENKLLETNSQEKINRLTAELNGKIIIINPEEIFFAYTNQNYVFLKRYDDKLISKYTLTNLENKLDKLHFFRTHRSFIVNLNKIQEVLPFFKSTCNLIMSDKENTKIPVSRRQTKKMRKFLDL